MLPRSGPPRIHADRSLSGVSPWSARARSRKAIMTVADGSRLLDDLRRRTSDRRRYQELFEFVPDGYVVSDGFGVIQEANQAASALLQERGAALAGRCLLDYVAPPERPMFCTYLECLRGGMQVLGWETTLQPRPEVRRQANVRVIA